MMFDFRQKGDYGDFIAFEEVSVGEWLSRTERFIDEVEQAINVLFPDE